MKTALSLLLTFALLLGCLPALAESATTVNFTGTDAVITGSGAVFAGGTLAIQAGGTYILSGTLENGQITVEADKTEKVTLRLSGLTVTNAAAPCIYVAKCDKTVIELAAGSENLLVSGVSLPDAPIEDASGAALQAKDDLKITGEGRLTVRGYLNNGIQTSNDLVIAGGVIDVTAAKNGLKGKDSLSVKGGEISVAALGDGLVSDGDIEITGGEISVTTGGGHILSAASEDASTAPPPQNQPQNRNNGGSGGGFGGSFGGKGGGRFDEGNPNKDETAPSAKGVKSGTALLISGGTLTVDARDDALHAQNITISGGSVSASSADDGLHADEVLSLSGGTVRVPTSYEGLEGKQVLISGGDIYVYATDDGVNAADGAVTASPIPNRMPATFDENAPRLEISGGNVVVIAEVDGLDSNGYLIISGGTTLVRGQNSSVDGALDADYTPIVTGGTLFAIGGITGVSRESTQCAFIASFRSTAAAGETVTVSKADGTVIYSAELPRDLSLFAFTAPELTIGETYTVTAGSQTATVAQTKLAVTATNNSGMSRGGRW